MLKRTDDGEGSMFQKNIQLANFSNCAGGWLSTVLMQWPMLLGGGLVNDSLLASFYILTRFYDAGALVLNQMNTRMYVEYSSLSDVDTGRRKKYLINMFGVYVLASVSLFLALPVIMYMEILDEDAPLMAVCLFISFFPYFLTSFRNSWYLVNKEFSAITVHGFICVAAFFGLFLGFVAMFNKIHEATFCY